MVPHPSFIQTRPTLIPTLTSQYILHNIVANLLQKDDNMGETYLTVVLCISINPSYPNIGIQILHTVLFTFPMMLTRRICLTIRSFLNW